jgi:hypothetical protein
MSGEEEECAGVVTLRRRPPEEALALLMTELAILRARLARAEGERDELRGRLRAAMEELEG